MNSSMFSTKCAVSDTFFSACSSCCAENTTSAVNSENLCVADAVLSVSVFLCVIIGLVCLADIFLLNLLLVYLLCNGLRKAKQMSF